MCDDVIHPTDKVIRFKDKYIYHQSCFHCVECKNDFKKGDFAGILHPKQILCYQHYSVQKSNILMNNYENDYNEQDTPFRIDTNIELLMNRSCNNSLQCAIFQDIPSPIMVESQCKEVQRIRREESDSINRKISEYDFERTPFDHIHLSTSMLYANK